MSHFAVGQVGIFTSALSQTHRHFGWGIAASLIGTPAIEAGCRIRRFGWGFLRFE